MIIAAVAVISFFDNTIHQKIVEVADDATWKEAYAKAIADGLMEGSEASPERDDWIAGLPDELAVARQALFDADMDLAVTFHR